jgi:hypothetical protein
MKIISFTGGYGAQIISAAAFFYINKIQCEDAGAYMGYFSQVPHLATPGVKDDMSHWQWELNNFGINITDFNQPNILSSLDVIWDGPEKNNFGFAGLRHPEISDLFPICNDTLKRKHEIFGDESFACMHLRRGDFLNVATHIVSDEAFLRVSKRIGKLVKNLLIVSDTPLSKFMLEGLKAQNINCITAIGGDPHLIHGLMRLSDIFIASNSQFSLTAAALKDETSLTLYPAQHDQDLQSYSNKFLEDIREFQVITKI